MVKVEAVLNDRPITYVSSDVDDPEPLTPSHLLYGRRITRQPLPTFEEDEMHDPNFDASFEIKRRATRQSMVLQHFRSRWRHEYLTSLCEFHRATGSKDQKIHLSDVVLGHDDNPRVNWKLGVIESQM